MFYLLLVVGYGLAATYPITNYPGVEGAGEQGSREQGRGERGNFLPVAPSKNCRSALLHPQYLFSQTVF